MIDSLYDLLIKLGYTDPLHAPITHMPIGLIFGALVFFLVAIIFNRQKLVLTARHASILAFVMVFPTILFGVFDWLHFFKGALITPIKIKMILASVVLVLLGAGIILGNEVKLRTWTMTGIYVLAFLACVGLGWFGAGIYSGTLTRGVSAAAAPLSEQPAGQPSGQAGGPPAGSAMKPAPSRASLDAGQKLYADNCQACHPSGGNIIVANLPLKSAKQLSSLGDFTAFIRAPKMPDNSQGSMPAFPKDLIDDSAMNDLYQYVLSMVRTSWK